MKYSPHKYQTYATDFILEHPVSAVFLDMGLGKSVITLTAIFDLCLDSFLVRKVLVIARSAWLRTPGPVKSRSGTTCEGLPTRSRSAAKPSARRRSCRGPVCTSSTGRTSSGWWRTAGYLSTMTWWSSMSCPPSKATRLSGSALC